MKNSNLLRNVHRMFTIPIYYNKRGKRKIPPHVLAFYSLSYLLLRERPDESPAVPVFLCAWRTGRNRVVCPRRGAQCAPKVRPKRRRGSCPCITGRVSPPAGGGTVSLRATGALRLAKSRRKAAVARMHARCGSRRGGLAPSCESPPPGDVRGCPRPQTNLSTFCGKICFAIISRRFGFAPNLRGGGADDVRFMFIVSVKATLRPGTQFGAPRSSRPPGWQSTPCLSQ